MIVARQTKTATGVSEDPGGVTRLSLAMPKPLSHESLLVITVVSQAGPINVGLRVGPGSSYWSVDDEWRDGDTGGTFNSYQSMIGVNRTDLADAGETQVNLSVTFIRSPMPYVVHVTELTGVESYHYLSPPRFAEVPGTVTVNAASPAGATVHEGYTYLAVAATTPRAGDPVTWTVNRGHKTVDGARLEYTDGPVDRALTVDVFGGFSPTGDATVPVTYTHAAHDDTPGDGVGVGLGVIHPLLLTSPTGGFYVPSSGGDAPSDPVPDPEADDDPSPLPYLLPPYPQASYDPTPIGGGRGTVMDKVRLMVEDAAGTMVDRIGPATEVHTDRTPLGVGTLTVTFRGDDLAPARSDALAMGRKCVLEVQTADGWEPIFTGTLTTPEVDLDVRVVAQDTDATLAAYLAEDCVPDVAMLGHVAQGTGVPVILSHTESAQVHGKNPRASALDQVCIARDSSRGYAWTSRSGDLVGARANSRSTTTAAHWSEADYARLTVDHNTHQLINDVRIKWLRYLPSSGATEPVSYGPWRDGASIRRWAPKQATYTLCGPVEDAELIGEYAQAVLERNAHPIVIPRTVTMPLKRVGDLAPGKALIDLGDLVRVTNTGRGVDTHVRVSRVQHEITPDQWTLTVGFDADGFVAKPFEVPDPENGHTHFLDDLADVETSTAVDGQVLTRQDDTWVAATPAAGGGGGSSTLAGLSDVSVPFPGNGQLLTYDGTKWVNSAPAALSMASLSDVSVTFPAAGQVMTYTASGWRNQAIPSPSAPSLAGLSDVSVTFPAVGHVVTYTSTGWKNQAIPAPPTPSLALGNLTDVSGTASTNMVLTYKGTATKWQPAALPPIPSALGDLSNVNVASPATNSVLTYKGTSTGWVAEVPATPAAGVTETIYTGANAFVVASGLTLSRARMVVHGKLAFLTVTVTGAGLNVTAAGSTNILLGTIPTTFGMTGTDPAIVHGRYATTNVPAAGQVIQLTSNMFDYRKVFLTWVHAAVSNRALTFTTTLSLA